MTRAEFASKVPSTFFSNLLGQCNLDIFVDTPALKGAGYKNSGGKLFIVSYGINWSELYEKLSVEVHDRGLQNIKAAVGRP